MLLESVSNIQTSVRMGIVCSKEKKCINGGSLAIEKMCLPENCQKNTEHRPDGYRQPMRLEVRACVGLWMVMDRNRKGAHSSKVICKGPITKES